MHVCQHELNCTTAHNFFLSHTCSYVRRNERKKKRTKRTYERTYIWTVFLWLYGRVVTYTDKKKTGKYQRANNTDELLNWLRLKCLVPEIANSSSQLQGIFFKLFFRIEISPFNGLYGLHIGRPLRYSDLLPVRPINEKKKKGFKI